MDICYVYQTSDFTGSKVKNEAHHYLSISVSLSLTLASFSALAPTDGRSFPTGSKRGGWHLADPVTLFQLPDLKDKTYSSSFNKIGRKIQPENKKKSQGKTLVHLIWILWPILFSKGKCLSGWLILDHMPILMSGKNKNCDHSSLRSHMPMLKEEKLSSDHYFYCM